MHKFVNFINYKEEAYVVLAIEKETKGCLEGKVLYYDSAYGSAVVRDYLETGTPYSVDTSFISSIFCYEGEEKIREMEEELQQGIARREMIGKLLIDSDEQIVQAIILSRSYDSDFQKYELNLNVLSSLPGLKAVDGIPQIASCGYHAREGADLEELTSLIREAFADRYDRTSSSGKYIPETKIIIDDKVVGTLADYDTNTLPFEELRDVAEVVFSVIRETELGDLANEQAR